LKTNRATVF